MKHTEEEILSIADNTLVKTNFNYDRVRGLSITEVDKDDREFIKPTWMVGFEFGKPFMPNIIALLFIDDETGKPLLIKHRHAKIILTVKNNGTIEKTIKRFGQK